MSYGLRPDEKYQGRVREGSALIESQGGTLGYQVMLECEDGRTFFTIWITEKNLDTGEIIDRQPLTGEDRVQELEQAAVANETQPEAAGDVETEEAAAVN